VKRLIDAAYRYNDDDNDDSDCDNSSDDDDGEDNDAIINLIYSITLIYLFL